MLIGMARHMALAAHSRWHGDRLLRGFGLLGLGELAVRVSRLVTTIVLARTLGSPELGLAATALAAFELVRVVGGNGVGQLVVKAPEARLAATCNTAWRLSLWLNLAMAAVQVLAGVVIAAFSGRVELLWLTACLASVFLLHPFAQVQSWLVQRNYQMGTLAGIGTLQVGVDNLLTALLAIAGLGAWAIVLPKLLTAPIWLIGMRRAVSWQRQPEAGGIPLGEMIRSAAPIVASEVLVAVRFNADKMLVGALLGLEALGLYFFAFSAGYGLSLVLTSALAAASFPHLADHKIDRTEMIARFDQALIRLAVPISLLVVLQAALVPFYVPILFGAKWDGAVVIAAVLCLSAATKSWHDLAAQLLRATGMQGRELAASLAFTVTSLGFLALGLTFGLLAGVTVLTIVTVTQQLLFAAWARRHVAGAGGAILLRTIAGRA